uniref:Uncharacterized protein n=1 Tax=Romanomermis culicivorax TaxID=13658 RepID=A0A915JM55_ROMCU
MAKFVSLYLNSNVESKDSMSVIEKTHKNPSPLRENSSFFGGGIFSRNSASLLTIDRIFSKSAGQKWRIFVVNIQQLDIHFYSDRHLL